MRLLYLCLLASWLPAIASAAAQEPRESPDFNSPVEAFDAYRKAIADRDWRGIFACSSEEGREELLFESCFGCNMELGGVRKEEVARLLKKYGIEPAVVDAEIAKRIEVKRERSAEKVTDEQGREIFKEALSDLLEDDAGFFVATQELLGRPELSSAIGQLEQVRVDGDHAEGKAQTTSYWFFAENNGPVKRQGRTKLKTYRFSKVGDSWFVDP